MNVDVVDDVELIVIVKQDDYKASIYCVTTANQYFALYLGVFVGFVNKCRQNTTICL